jgi:ribosome-associated protein
MIRIDDNLQIPESEIVFTASRGGGPGGQHVNKVATRVTLRFDVRNSASLDDAQRRRIESRLANRINKEGVLQLSSHATRSQAANKERLLERFAELLAGALKPRRRRRRTSPSRAARERRLREKRQRAETKRRRRPVRDRDE